MPSETDSLVNEYFDEPIKSAAILTACVASLTGLLLGYDIGVTGGSLLPVTNYFKLSEREQETFVGMLGVGAMPGCFAGGMLADFFGRRTSIGIGASVFLVGNTLQTFAPTFYVLVIGRALAGFAVGMTMVIEPLYTAETSPARIRGMLNTNVEVSFVIGILLAQCNSWKFMESEHLSDEMSFRYMMGFSLVFPILSLIGVFFVIPESPRWLASRHQLSEARTVLHWLLSEAEAESALTKLQIAEVEVDRQLSWGELFSIEDIRWKIFAGCGVAFFSQATGNDPLLYYSNTILADAGLSRSSCLLATVAMGVCKLMATVLSGSVVDRCGRRPLLMISSMGMSMSMGTVGVACLLTAAWRLKLTGMVSFQVFFAIGVGPIIYILNAEMYPKNCRTKGLVLALAIGRLVSATVLSTFLGLAGLLTFAGAFFFYAAIGIVAAVFVHFVVPETKGTHLEDQDHRHVRERRRSLGCLLSLPSAFAQERLGARSASSIH